MHFIACPIAGRVYLRSTKRKRTRRNNILFVTYITVKWHWHICWGRTFLWKGSILSVASKKCFICYRHKIPLGINVCIFFKDPFTHFRNLIKNWGFFVLSTNKKPPSAQHLCAAAHIYMSHTREGLMAHLSRLTECLYFNLKCSRMSHQIYKCSR